MIQVTRYCHTQCAYYHIQPLPNRAHANAAPKARMQSHLQTALLLKRGVNTSGHSLVQAICSLSPVTDTSFATISRELRIPCGRQSCTYAQSICDLPAAWFRGRRYDSTTSKLRRNQLASETPFSNNGVPFCLTMHHACTAPLL